MEELKYRECAKHPGNNIVNCIYCKMEESSKINLNSSVLVLGDGLLGSEIVKQTNWDYISRKKDGFKVTDPGSWDFREYKTIVNCIAHTDTYSKGRELHWKINYQFVYDLIQYCNQNSIKLVHISTEYLYTGSVDNATENDVPVHCDNWYGYTKLLGDGLVQLLSKDYLLCRCMHKPNPFPYDSAWIDQVGNFDYVDVISKKIIDLISFGSSGVYNVGTDLKSIFELASKTKNVKAIMAPKDAPKNITMSVDKMSNTLIKPPFFSIAIPTYEYNGKGVFYLENSFNMMYRQTFKDFEVIVSDHSKNSDIQSLCERWKNKLKIVYIRNEEGRGIHSINLNVALDNSRGKWIKILFQDDYLYDDKSLESTKNFIDRKEGIVWMSSRYIHDNGLESQSLFHDFTPRWVDNIWAGNNLIGSPSGITIKNQNILHFSPEFILLMDCDFYMRMYKIYGKPEILDEFITVVNRVNSDRLENVLSDDKKRQEFIRSMELYGPKF